MKRSLNAPCVSASGFSIASRAQAPHSSMGIEDFIEFCRNPSGGARFIPNSAFPGPPATGLCGGKTTDDRIHQIIGLKRLLESFGGTTLFRDHELAPVSLDTT